MSYFLQYRWQLQCCYRTTSNEIKQTKMIEIDFPKRYNLLLLFPLCAECGGGSLCIAARLSVAVCISLLCLHCTVALKAAMIDSPLFCGAPGSVIRVPIPTSLAIDYYWLQNPRRCLEAPHTIVMKRWRHLATESRTKKNYFRTH